MDNNDNNAIILRLWRSATTAALASLDEDGTPYVSLVTIACLKNGSASLLLSDLARHTKNVKRTHHSSLLITDDLEPGVDPLTSSRITVTGTIEPAQGNQIDHCRTGFLAAHPASSQYIDFADFSLYQFQGKQIHLVGGFGRIVTTSADILT